MTMKTIMLSMLTCVAVAKHKSHGMLSKGDKIVVSKKGKKMLKSKKSSAPMVDIGDGDALLTHADTMTEAKKGHNMVQPKPGEVPVINVATEGPAADGDVLLTSADTITEWPTGRNMIQSKPGEVPAVSTVESPSDDGEVMWKVKPHMAEAKKYKPAKGNNMIQPKPGEEVTATEGKALWTNTHEDVISKVKSAAHHAKYVKHVTHEDRAKMDDTLNKVREAVDNIPQKGKIAG